MSKKVDLHMHTSYSDGALTPFELLKLAKERGLETISITDHDSVYALESAMVYGKEMGIEVIPGVELSTDIEGTEIHLLGYFIDFHNSELNKYLKFFREERYERAKRIVKKLEKLGFQITIDDVTSIAKNSAIGRPHIAKVLFDSKQVKSFIEVFDKYLGDNRPAYEKKIYISPQSALKIVSDAGGLCFIAHPGFMKESILKSLINIGLDGIEVIHPSHKQFQVKFYRGIVNEYCLLQSGGSDFHGGERNDFDNFGKYYTSGSSVINMKRMLTKSRS